MGSVVLDMAMSLDGIIAGTNDEDYGLHEYFFAPSSLTAQVIEEGINMTGAIIMGKRSYEIGAQQDGFADNPYKAAHFIITHHIPQKIAKGAESFVFVTDGTESALRQAQVAAGAKDVVIGGGANIAQQFIKAGLLDEIQIHLIPKLLGRGIRLFDQLGSEPIELKSTRVIESTGVTHLKFRIVR